MRVNKAAIALLADRVIAAFIWPTGAIEHPPLGIVVLRRTRDQAEVQTRVLVRVHKAPIALLLDSEHASDWYQKPLLRPVTLRRPCDQREVPARVFMRVHEPAIALLPDGVQARL